MERKEAEKLKSEKRDLIQSEREKILRTKKGEIAPVHEIKETNINRPEDDLVENTKEIKKEIPLVDEPAKDEVPVIKNIPLKESKPQIIDSDKEAAAAEEAQFPVEYLEDYKLPPLELLDEPLKEELDVISDDELKENGRLLQAKLLNFGVKIEKVIATPGPVVTLYELVPAEDVKLSRIESLQDDIALAMKARGIRMIIPIPGKGTVGVEIPNHKSIMVKIRSVVGSKKYNDSSLQLPIALGKTISGEVYIEDLAKMPHLLIAGSTGSGKSVGINTIITSLIYKL
jgi:S-DNA-T family DNA segregation ATPase FtsK/SpoIIIE